MADIETTAVDANGTPIVTMKIIDKETGTETPVNVSTCTEAVKCSKGVPMEQHLANLYNHANSEGAHLAEGEKAELETKAGAQAKAAAAKNEAIVAASLEIAAAKIAAAEDAATKAADARDAAYRYTDGFGKRLSNHEANANNPHNVTAAQVGLGNVANKAPNDMQITYSKESTLSELVSGERLAVAFGKIAKAVADLIAHISNKANPHGVTASQIGAAPAIADSTYPSCYYRMVGGNKEWINPPMVEGVEYRTTKRRNGKVVYDKYIDLGNLPANGEKSTGYFGSGSTSVEYEAFVKTDSGHIFPMPFFTTKGTNGANVYATKYSIVVVAQYEVNAHTGFAIVHYTKD